LGIELAVLIFLLLSKFAHDVTASS